MGLYTAHITEKPLAACTTPFENMYLLLLSKDQLIILKVIVEPEFTFIFRL